MHQWVLCYSSGFKEWNHGWKIRASHGWHHHPRPHQHHHFFTHHPHCYTHFCRYSLPHYSMMIIMIVIWGENWSLQVLFLSLTTLLTSSIATSPRVSSPTINRFEIWSQVDFAISALTGWILIHYLFITLAVAASGFLLAHRWIFSQHRLHPHPGQASLPGRFSKGALDHLREVGHYQIRAISIRLKDLEGTFPLFRDMDVRFLSTFLPGYFLSVILYWVAIEFLKK